MYLTLLKEVKRNHGSTAICRCRCGHKVLMPMSEFTSGHRKTCGRSSCNSSLLSEIRTGRPRPDMLGRRPHNWKDLTGKRHRRLIFICHLKGSRWLCRCDCGNETEVLVTNLSRTNGCRHCANRKDISGERVGLLVAISPETETVRGRNPLWTFRCDCGNTIQGTVREFHAQWLRSCGCKGNVYGSWASMMSRCYNRGNNRYRHYGGRGIRVCRRWHNFDNFVADMGERPKRHTLSRKNCEEHYTPQNCIWEHITKNTADTCLGKPTKPGIRKGAKLRQS